MYLLSQDVVIVILRWRVLDVGLHIPPVSSFLCDPFGVFLWFIIVPNWVKVKFFSKIFAIYDAISVICPREGIFVIQYISLREVRLYG